MRVIDMAFLTNRPLHRSHWGPIRQSHAWMCFKCFIRYLMETYQWYYVALEYHVELRDFTVNSESVQAKYSNFELWGRPAPENAVSYIHHHRPINTISDNILCSLIIIKRINHLFKITENRLIPGCKTNYGSKIEILHKMRSLHFVSQKIPANKMY